MTSRRQMEIDERNVGHELLENPTLDAEAIAEKLGLSRQKVWRIIKKMEEDGAIAARVASFNTKAMGKRTFLILLERSYRPLDDRFKNEARLSEFNEEVRRQGCRAVVETSYYMNGAHDWAIVLTVDEHQDLIVWMELWRRHYGEYFSKITQSEVMWTLIRNSVINSDFQSFKKMLS